MTKTVIATFSVVGFHAWPRAPEEVAYLASLHRHEFRFRLEAHVLDADREIEFHTLKRLALLTMPKLFELGSERDEYLFGSRSCEMIAEILLDDLKTCGVHAVECWEDGECGARVEL